MTITITRSAADRTPHHWVFVDILDALGETSVVADRDGAALLIDGPFVETKERRAQ
jgi:hypothetical protein